MENNEHRSLRNSNISIFWNIERKIICNTDTDDSAEFWKAMPTEVMNCLVSEYYKREDLCFNRNALIQGIDTYDKYNMIYKKHGHIISHDELKHCTLIVNLHNYHRQIDMNHRMFNKTIHRSSCNPYINYSTILDEKNNISDEDLQLLSGVKLLNGHILNFEFKNRTRYEHKILILDPYDRLYVSMYRNVI